MVPVMDALLSLDSAAGGSAPGTGRPPMPPHDPDWLLPLGAIIIALFALACIMVFIIIRWGSCNKDRPPSGVSMFEHECLVASLTMVLLLVLSLASLYYYFCYRGGCYGAALDGPAAAGMAGRKGKMMGR